MRMLFLLLLLLATPAHAQLQFDTAELVPSTPAPQPPSAHVTNIPKSGPGVAWLQKTPMTLFDLGMMELTETASKLATGGAPEDALQGAVAEFQEEKNLIIIGFYSALDYDAPACIQLAQRLRDGMFLHRKDPAQLAREVGSYFISYGPLDPARPRSIGQELVGMVRIAVYQQDGVCQLPLDSDKAEVSDDPTVKKDSDTKKP